MVLVLWFSSKVWHTKQTIRNTVSAYPRMPFTWFPALQNDNDRKLKSRRSRENVSCQLTTVVIFHEFRLQIPITLLCEMDSSLLPVLVHFVMN